MKKTKLCDFCLNEEVGLFKYPQSLPSGHHICRSCVSRLKTFKLPIKYDIFQLLALNDPSIHEVIMKNFLQEHSIEEVIAKHYPLPNMLLHKGEHCINQVDATITVDKAQFPANFQPLKICDINKFNINDICTYEQGIQVSGKLYQTNAATYFISEHFINCHRNETMIKEHTDQSIIFQTKQGIFQYSITNPLFFRLRYQFYQFMMKKNPSFQNLIYLASENTMVLTPGEYEIPKNIRSGSYWVSATQPVLVTDRNGTYKQYLDGLIELEEGSKLSSSQKFELRLNPKTHEEKL